MSALSLGNPETAYAHNPKPDRTQSFVSFQMPSALEAFIKSLLLLGFFLLSSSCSCLLVLQWGQSCELRSTHLFRPYHTHMPIHTTVARWQQLMARMLS
jgi:hypothetical protein